jgi:hypothetical protein|tara:strand:- start:343 stop:507 length:165 start_codon:yes stop_codon:yes gene_type:complete
MVDFELNDLLFSLENSSKSAKDLIDYINAYVIGPTQSCCEYCKSLSEAEHGNVG